MKTNIYVLISRNCNHFFVFLTFDWLFGANSTHRVVFEMCGLLSKKIIPLYNFKTCNAYY